MCYSGTVHFSNVQHSFPPAICSAVAQRRYIILEGLEGIQLHVNKDRWWLSELDCHMITDFT